MSYTRDSELDLVYNSETDSYEPVLQEYVLTINPTPLDATVVLTATGFEQEGNSITVNSGTTVSYVISKTGYKTVSDEITVTEDQTLAISLLVDNNIHIQHLRGTTSQINNYTGKEGEITYDTITHTLRVHDGIKKGGYEISGSSSSNYHPDLFDYKWADHELNDVQWLRADTFSWQSSAVYQAAYQHLANDLPEASYGIVLQNDGTYYRYADGDVTEDRNPYCWSNGTSVYFTRQEIPSVGDYVYQSSYATQTEDTIISVGNILPTPETETIAGITISFYTADDGHKICLPDQESNVQAIYAATGVAWYYIIDTTNQRFKLPRAKHNKYTESLSVVGTGNVLGLTNGSVTYGLNSGSTYARLTMGNNAGDNVSSSGGYDAGYNVNWKLGVATDPTLSGLTTTSIEQDTDQYKYLYFYVGSFTQSALENTAGITTETLNDKLDLDLGNASASTKQEIAALCFPDFTSPTRTGLSLNTSYQAESNGYVKISASTGGDIYSLTSVSIQVSNDNSTFSVVAANAAYSTGGQHVLIAPVRRGQYFKGTGSSGSMEFFSI